MAFLQGEGFVTHPSQVDVVRGAWCLRRAISPGVDWLASVTSWAEVGPGLAGPPSVGTKDRGQDHDGARVQLHADRCSCHLVTSFRLVVRPRNASASEKRCAQNGWIRARGGPLRTGAASSLRRAPWEVPRGPCG